MPPAQPPLQFLDVLKTPRHFRDDLFFYGLEVVSTLISHRYKTAEYSKALEIEASMLYLMQHGACLPKDQDQKKPLSDEGIRAVEGQAERFASFDFNHIFHSGKLRAEQTALIMAQTTLSTGKPEKLEGLMPTDPVEPIAELIGNWKGDNLICSHLPFLQKLISYLVLWDDEKELIEFEPGILIALKRKEKGKWAIELVVPPTLPESFSS